MQSINVPFVYRKYFKLRNEVCKDDITVLNKFKVIQLKEKLQNDAHNCGVYCLKVPIPMAICTYTVLIIKAYWCKPIWLNIYYEEETSVNILLDTVILMKLECR